jgi:hypothetical protein
VSTISAPPPPGKYCKCETCTRDEDVKDLKSLRYSLASALSAVDKDGKVVEGPERFLREETTTITAALCYVLGKFLFLPVLSCSLLFITIFISLYFRPPLPPPHPFIAEIIFSFKSQSNIFTLQLLLPVGYLPIGNNLFSFPLFPAFCSVSVTFFSHAAVADCFFFIDVALNVSYQQEPA